MGNSNVIYQDKCLDYQFEELKNCPVYEEHLKTEKYINHLGKTFERLVYQSNNSFDVPDSTRISWYQIMGQSLKEGGQLMPQTDPFNNCITMTGRGEKLIGQMENEFSLVCNSLLLQSIQEIRIYSQTMVRSNYLSFLEAHNSLRLTECNSMAKCNSDTEYYKLIDLLKEKRDHVRELHIQLHKDVIYVYETVLKMKLVVPAIIEHQLRYNLYSTEYLEYILHLFKENKAIQKEIIPLQKCKGDILSYIPDYRMTIQKHINVDPTQDRHRPVPCNDFMYQSTKPNVYSDQIKQMPCKELPSLSETLKLRSEQKTEPIPRRKGIYNDDTEPIPPNQERLQYPVRSADEFMDDSKTKNKKTQKKGNTGLCKSTKAKKSIVPVKGPDSVPGDSTILEESRPVTPAEEYDEIIIKPGKRRKSVGVSKQEDDPKTETKHTEEVKMQKGCGGKAKKKPVSPKVKENVNSDDNDVRKELNEDPVTRDQINQVSPDYIEQGEVKKPVKKSKSTSCGKRKKNKDDESKISKSEKPPSCGKKKKTKSQQDPSLGSRNTENVNSERSVTPNVVTTDAVTGETVTDNKEDSKISKQKSKGSCGKRKSDKIEDKKTSDAKGVEVAKKPSGCGKKKEKKTDDTIIIPVNKERGNIDNSTRETENPTNTEGVTGNQETIDPDSNVVAEEEIKPETKDENNVTEDKNPDAAKTPVKKGKLPICGKRKKDKEKEKDKGKEIDGAKSPEVVKKPTGCLKKKKDTPKEDKPGEEKPKKKKPGLSCGKRKKDAEADKKKIDGDVAKEDAAVEDTSKTVVKDAD